MFSNSIILSLVDKYDLASLADSSNTFDTVVGLMGWIRDNIRYDGSTLIHPEYNARDLLAHGFQKQENVLNCRMLATILAELLLVAGWSGDLSDGIELLPEVMGFNVTDGHFCPPFDGLDRR